MAKKFDALVIAPQRRPKNKIKFSPEYKHHGLDTETLHGKCLLLCDDTGGHIKFLPDELFPYTILSYLTQYKFYKSINWFFNLDYDVRAILRHFPQDLIQELYINHTIMFGKYKIDYLPHKLFSITRENFKKYKFYDIFQFFGSGSLDDNAKKYLNSQKNHDVESKKLGSDWQYWIDNYDNVIKYCIQDAKLTREMAEFFYDRLYKTIKFSSPRPYSTGSIAEQYFINAIYYPTINKIPTEVLRYHQDAYSGGRVEILQRGYFPNVYSYDIKSAYPAVMRELLDYNEGRWVKTQNFNNPIAGIYKTVVDWYHPQIGAFPVSQKNTLIYPNGKFEKILNEQEILWLEKNHSYCEFEIIDGYEFYPAGKFTPFKDIIDELYFFKETYEDDAEKLIYKLMLNSIYGKSAQAIKIKNSDGLYKTGNLYNPINASRCTALTRLKILDLAMQDPESIIGFYTDSVHSTQKLTVPKYPNIGDFGPELDGVEEICIMAGIRWCSDVNEGGVNKMRGYNNICNYNPDTDEVEEVIKINLKEILEQNKLKKKIPVYLNKPVTLFDGAFRRNNFEDMNKFDVSMKILNINGDFRRVWDEDFRSAHDALHNNYRSIPIFVDSNE